MGSLLLQLLLLSNFLGELIQTIRDFLSIFDRFSGVNALKLIFATHDLVQNILQILDFLLVFQLLKVFGLINRAIFPVRIDHSIDPTQKVVISPPKLLREVLFRDVIVKLVVNLAIVFLAPRHQIFIV